MSKYMVFKDFNEFSSRVPDFFYDYDDICGVNDGCFEISVEDDDTCYNKYIFIVTNDVVLVHHVMNYDKL